MSADNPMPTTIVESRELWFEYILLSQRARNRGLFDHTMAERLINGQTAFGRQLWGVLCLELWHNQFIDPQ